MTLCRRPDECQVTVFCSVKELPASWDQFLPAEHPLRSAALALYETAALPGISYYYALTGEPHAPVALAYFQVLAIEGKHLSNDLLADRWKNGVLRLLINMTNPKLLVAGHLFRHDIPTFYNDARLSNMDAFRMYEQMIEQVAKRVCAQAVLVKDMPEQLATYFRNFAPDYISLRNDISMEMDIRPEWENLQDYEAALKHKYAQRLRKVRQNTGQLSISELDAAAVAAEKDRIFQLYLQVTERQPVRLGYLNSDFIPLLKRTHPDNFRVWGFYEQGRMVAFASAWLHGQAFDMYYIGFDYSRNNDLQLYFNILFFSVEQAISIKASRLILGRTALDAKARMGCKPKYLETLLYVRNRFLNNMVHQQQTKQYEQEGAWEDRHPFKSK